MKLNMQLIRHGKTEAVDRMIYSGFSDLPLTDAGKSEIDRFVKEKLYHSADSYYTSGLSRAVETLELIAGNVNYGIIPELKECNFGEFELRKHDDLMHDPDYVAWINDVTGNYVIPHGESTTQFHDRVEKGFRILFNHALDENSEKILLTSHGGVIGYFANKYCDDSMNFYEAMPSHGLGYEIDLMVEKESFRVENFKRIENN